jgi:glucose/arabinose dehydrogenase
MLRRACAVLIVLALPLAACGGGGGKATPTPTLTQTLAATATATPPATATPGARIPNTSPATELTLPAGFTAYTIAEGFKNPTSIALAPDGTVYISDQGGAVYRLVDANGDGVFEDHVRFASGFAQTTGIMIGPDGTLYVSSKGKVTTVRDTNGDGVGDQQNDIITGLPHGNHQNNGLVIGPDGKLYITNGSDCDDCVEQDPRSATILQANIDGSGLRVYARGLRNPYDLVFDSQGRLWASDNGSDTPCATIDEIDFIVDGGDYGWPYGADGCDPYHDGTPPAGNLGLHTAATGITFYSGAQFPPDYQGNLFVTLWGGLIGPAQPYGPSLVRARIQERSAGPAPGGGYSVQVESFATGFQHPIDVVTDRDGTLLVLDYGSGKLYRLIYTAG